MKDNQPKLKEIVLSVTESIVSKVQQYDLTNMRRMKKDMAGMSRESAIAATILVSGSRY